MKRYIIFTILPVLVAFAANAQERRTADEYFANSMYSNALPLYERLYAKTKEKEKELKAELAYRVGECCRLLNRTNDALHWYDSTLRYGSAEPQLMLHYGESLLREGQYMEAEKYLQQYLLKNPGDSLGQGYLASTVYSRERTNNPYLRVTPLKQINTAGYEYGIGEFDGRLVYAYGAKGTKNVSARTAVAQSEILSVDLSHDGDLVPEPMKGLHKKGCSECCMAYDPLMNVGYITRTSPVGKPHTQIIAYEYHAGKKKWEKPAKNKRGKLFSIPGKVTGHPFITPDGQRMYFAGILDGGYGGSDIWYVERQTDGSWGAPVNAGATVNTANNEMFPSSYDDILYFASTGHVGFGGYDLFASKREGAAFGQAWNLGKPYNSHRDDMALLISEQLSSSFFVSDRGENTLDDIYAVTKGHPFNLEIKGLVMDAATGQPVAGARVTVKIPDEAEHTAVTDTTGHFTIHILPEKSAGLNVSKPGYTSPETKILPPFDELFGLLDLTVATQNPNAVLWLNETKAPATIAEAIPADTVAPQKPQFVHVYYGFAQTHACTESLPDLDRLIDYMKTHPDVRIAIAAHTDSRGSDNYNQILSARRAHYIVNYLKSKGIDSRRITWKALGEQSPSVVNAQNEQEHALNRRSEFTVIDSSGKIIIHSKPLPKEAFTRFCGRKEQ